MIASAAAGRELAATADDVAGRLVAEFRPETPFGFRYRHPTSGWELDLPGLLEGTTGIGLVLSAYASDRPPASGWDSILMLS